MPTFKCACLVACSNKIQHALEFIFGSIGRIVGYHPWKTIIATIIVCGLCSLGFLNWTTESRASKLWIPQNTIAVEQAEWVADIFGYESRSAEILLKPTIEDSNGNINVLTVEYILQFWKAYYLMVNTSTMATNGYRDEFPGYYSWDGYQNSTAICLNLGTECTMETIFDIVGYSYTSINNLNDDTLLSKVNNATDDLTSILGGMEYDSNGEIVRAIVLRGSFTISAAAITDNNELIDPSREAWEITVLDKILDASFVDCTVIPYFEESFSIEFEKGMESDVKSYAIGCLLLIAYTAVALGKRDYVHSMVGLAVCAIITVALAVLTSYGLASAMSIPYTPLSSSLPFLILGLGVDDAFIIAGEFQQQTKNDLTRKLSAAQRMEHAMRHAGVSVLITSLTDFVAFSIGASTVLPALQAFCLYAAFGVFSVFCLNCSFFAACVVIDAGRAEDNRLDYFLCCIKLKTLHIMFPKYEHLILSCSQSLPSIANQCNSSNSSSNGGTTNETNDVELKSNVNDDNNNGGDIDRPYRMPCCGCLHLLPTELSRKMFATFGKCLMRPLSKIFVIVIALGVLCFSCYSASQLEQDFNINWFIPDSSYLQEYFDWKDEYFNEGTPLFIYTKDFDYRTNSQLLIQSNSLLTSSSYLTGYAYDWHKPFTQYVNTSYYGINITNDDEYYTELYTWLSSIGSQYSGLVEWEDDSNPLSGIAGAFQIGQYKESAVADAAAQVDAMIDARDDVKQITSDTNEMFAFTFQMLFWEQFAVISTELWRNLLLSFCVVFVITLFLIPRFSAALLVLLSVGASIVDVLGFMRVWGLSIDAVTVCYTVIAIGLAVDYSAHVGEAFVFSNAGTKNERVIDALFRIGASVFNGAFSTFLAVVAMANSSTYIFRVFFQQFFLVTLLGSIHGLIVLPVLLSLFGPSDPVIQSHVLKSSSVKTLSLKSVETNEADGNKPTTNQASLDTTLSGHKHQVNSASVNFCL